MKRKIAIALLCILIIIGVGLTSFVLVSRGFSYNKNLEKSQNNSLSIKNGNYIESYKKEIYSSDFVFVSSFEEDNYYLEISDDIFSLCSVDSNDCKSFHYKKSNSKSDVGNSIAYIPLDDIDLGYFVAHEFIDKEGENIIQITQKDSDNNYYIIYFK